MTSPQTDDLFPLTVNSPSRTLRSSLQPLNMNRNGVERNGNVDPVYTQQGPQYTLPVQSFSQKMGYQNRQEAEDRLKVIPSSGSYGYSSSGRETAPLPEYMSDVGEYGLRE